MTNPLVAKLEAVAPLSGEDRQAVEALCANTRAVAKGRDIVREGERPEHIHFLLQGWAARYKVLPDGARQITAFLIPGDPCNMEAAVLDRMEHGVVALTTVTVANVSRAALAETTRVRPGVAQAFLWATLVAEAVLRAWLVNLGRRDAHARVAHLACELHARMRRVGLAGDGEIALPVTQEDLADALGLTPVHVNRILRRLRDEGLMALRNRTLTILNAEGLSRAAGFDPAYLHAAAA